MSMHVNEDIKFVYMHSRLYVGSNSMGPYECLS